MGNFIGIPKKSTEEGSPNPEERTIDEIAGNQFAQKLIDTQNIYRMKHGADPLILDDGLCKQAQEWAECLASMGKLEHSNTDDGENLAFRGQSITVEQIADMWYHQLEYYDFNDPGFTNDTGHFSQMVWVDSKTFGAGFAKGKKGTYVVGRYRPAGNDDKRRSFRRNVLPLK